MSLVENKHNPFVFLLPSLQSCESKYTKWTSTPFY